MTFFEYVAEQVREILASLGFRSLRRGDRARRGARHRAGDRALEGRRARPDADARRCRRRRTATSLTKAREQDHGLDAALDNTLIQLCEGALLDGSPVRLELPVRNVNRTVGTMLGSLVTRRYGADGLPPGTIDITFTGSAGQSFGAFVPRGITLRLVGDANDYVGKGLSGGVLAVRPHPSAVRAPSTTSSPATSSPTARPAARSTCAASSASGSCVRNSGATVVAEGSRRPCAGVHDRRHRGDPRPDRAQRRCRHVRRLRLRPRPRPATGQRRTGGRRSRARRARPSAARRSSPRTRRYTGSTVAQRLLADWPAALRRGSARSSPRDFRRVLEATARARPTARTSTPPSWPPRDAP